MNRVRNYNDKFQVLITPCNKFDTGFELMLGNWTDEHLKNYHIMEFPTFEQALEESNKYPNIDWMKLVNFHKDIYVKLYKIIKSELETYSFIVEFEPKLADPFELKHAMFNRVLKFGNRFRLCYDLNDIIGYHIINPWISNLKEISKILESNDNLRISKIVNDKTGIIRLIGTTDIGTTYEIVLWTTLVANWARWVNKHEKLDEKIINDTLNNILQTQDIINKSNIIR